MTGFIVKALTKAGTQALDVCIQEEKVELQKHSILERMKFNKIWIQDIKRNPLSYSMIINKNAERMLLLADPQLISKSVAEVKIAMRKNGAEFGLDYDVEVL